ncbi:MAG: hypothetical protein DRJ52_00835 [Thermoprotei archaeon]|nr:MAG: hypothetical protein DRJ52_00835 [Thermoprotei archaeon]RLF00437.1 MAG: hypothetical protein DRJ63_02550 [Thermoprotei archaeon]
MSLELRGFILKKKRLGLKRVEDRVGSYDLLNPPSRKNLASEDALDFIGPAENKIPLSYFIKSTITRFRAGFYLIVFSKAFSQYTMSQPGNVTYRYIILKNPLNNSLEYISAQEYLRKIECKEIKPLNPLDILAVKALLAGIYPKSWEEFLK